VIGGLCRARAVPYSPVKNALTSGTGKKKGLNRSKVDAILDSARFERNSELTRKEGQKLVSRGSMRPE